MLFPKGTRGVTVSSAGWGQPAPGLGPSVRVPSPWPGTLCACPQPRDGTLGPGPPSPPAAQSPGVLLFEETAIPTRGARGDGGAGGTAACRSGRELGAEGPLLVKLGVLTGSTCLRNLRGSGNVAFALGLGPSRGLRVRCAELCFCAGKIFVPEEFC